MTPPNRQRMVKLTNVGQSRVSYCSSLAVAGSTETATTESSAAAAEAGSSMTGVKVNTFYVDSTQTPSRNTKITLQYGFKALDIVWAKVKSYPNWPGIICNSSESRTFWNKSGNEFHVQFFGKVPTWAWVARRDVEKLTETNAQLQTMKKTRGRFSRDFNMSIDQALEAASLDEADRYKLIKVHLLEASATENANLSPTTTPDSSSKDSSSSPEVISNSRSEVDSAEKHKMEKRKRFRATMNELLKLGKDSGQEQVVSRSGKRIQPFRSSRQKRAKLNLFDLETEEASSVMTSSSDENFKDVEYRLDSSETEASESSSNYSSRKGTKKVSTNSRETRDTKKLSAYELLRLENIKRKEEALAALNLAKAKERVAKGLKIPSTKKPTKQPGAKKTSSDGTPSRKREVIRIPIYLGRRYKKMGKEFE